MHACARAFKPAGRKQQANACCAVPETDEIRRALTTMLSRRERRATFEDVQSLPFFRRNLPEGAFEMADVANARLVALPADESARVLRRLQELTAACRVTRPLSPAPRAPTAPAGAAGVGKIAVKSA